MTDLIARDANYNIYSYIDIQEKFPDGDVNKKLKLYCMGCGSEIGFRKESKPFDTKYTQNKVKRAHFFHYKGSECSFKQEVENDSDDDNDDRVCGFGKNELDKRITILKYLIKKTWHSYYSYKENQDILFQHIKKAKKYKIDYKSFMNDFVKNVYEKRVVNIGFKDIEYLDVNLDVLYIINDYPISDYLTKKICEDDDLFFNYIKKISTISIYYSRCNANKNIEQEIKKYGTELALARFIEDE